MEASLAPCGRKSWRNTAVACEAPAGRGSGASCPMACVAFIVQQPPGHAMAVIEAGMGQLAPVPIALIGQPGAQGAGVPIGQGGPASAGCTASRAVASSAANRAMRFICCIEDKSRVGAR